MASEIASEVTPGQFSLDDLLLGDAVLDDDALDEMDGSEGMEGGDFFKLSAQEWQNRTLLPLKEDLAMWISELIDADITPEDFFEKLSSGVILCRLAKYISEQEVQWKGASSATPFKAPINTRSGPFFSRENLTNFLRWCRALHINDTCLFESSDLVLQRLLKNVIVCLYAIARRFKSLPNLKLPALIQLEDELDSLENDSAYGSNSSNEVQSEHSLYSGRQSMCSQTDEPDYDDPHGFSKSVSVLTSVLLTSEPLQVMTSPMLTSEDSLDVVTSRLTSEPLEVNHRKYESSNSRTHASSRGSRIPRYSPKNPKDSSSALKPSRSYGCLSSATSSENIFSANRARKSSIPILATTQLGAKTAKTPFNSNSLTSSRAGSMKDINKINNKNSSSSNNTNSKNNNSSNNKQQTKTPAPRSKSLDMRKHRAVLTPTTTINIDKQRKTSVEERKVDKHEPRSKFCKTGCTPQKRCCLKQEVEPKKRKPREEDYVIMDLDEETASKCEQHSKFEKPKSKFDYKIRRIIRKCKCEDRMIVKKLAEGTYLINDKKVYIRILNRKHVMVRVGGGWQTFEEYLIRHDPQRISVFARDGVAMLDNTARPTSDRGFLVASSTYKSPSLNNSNI